MRQIGEAIGRRGRQGTVASVSGSYEHDVRIPGTKAAGVTPEELLAGAWVACFGETFIYQAEMRKIDASEAQFKASVVLEIGFDDYTITEARLEVRAPGIDRAVVEDLIELSHANCPVSKLLVAGAPTVVVSSADTSLQGTATGGAVDDRD